MRRYPQPLRSAQSATPRPPTPPTAREASGADLVAEPIADHNGGQHIHVDVVAGVPGSRYMRS